ncbi:MAG: NAD(P)/FAD-dependent oxidoreductase [Moorellaceae bacterium]
MDAKEYDVVIIGAGVVGTAIARLLSSYHLKLALVEKEADVGCGASKANSAIVHTGFDAPPGTLEARLVVAANPMFDRVAYELDVPFKRLGALLLATDGLELAELESIERKAHQNGVFDLIFLTPEQVRAYEPAANPQVLGAFFIPRESIIDPFLLTVHQAECAVQNGVDLYLGTKVTGFVREDGRLRAVKTDSGLIRSRYFVNAAGMFSDSIVAMAQGKLDFTVTPRKGEFFVLDKNVPGAPRHILLPVPTKVSKGKLVTPTIHGNILIGPTAEDVEDKEDTSTTRRGLESILAEAQKLWPQVDTRYTITQYCGTRAVKKPEGYEIGEDPQARGLINVLGVRSTGVTASLSIAVYVADALREAGLKLVSRADYHPYIKSARVYGRLPAEEWDELVRRDPRYGRIVCRCEWVTEGEIVAALHRPVPVTTMDGLKRRLRTGMGRCQGGFCGPRLARIMARELGISVESVTKSGGTSRYVLRSMEGEQGGSGERCGR